MKKTINNLLIVFVSLIILLTSIHYLEFILRPTDTDGCISAIKAFHELPTNSIDVIGYGSSLMWKSLNTKYIYDKYKINAYNYGNNWQNINTTLLFIEDSLRSQSPKLVIIETSRMNKLLIDSDVNGQVYYTKEIKNFDGKKEYLKQVFNKDQKKYIAYYFPIYNLHENWKNINKDSFIMNDKKQKYIDNRGYNSGNSIYTVKLDDYHQYDQIELSNDVISVLDKIMDLSIKNNFKVLFFKTPNSEEYNYSNALAEYAKEHNAYYIDFLTIINEIGIDGNLDFRDSNHLNDNGANKVSDYIAKFILDNKIIDNK